MNDKRWDEMTGKEVAIAYCKKEIADYGKFFDVNHRKWLFWQRVAIWCGVIGTVAVSINLPNQAIWVNWIKAIPVALASIATGLMGSFSYQADAVRQGATGDALQGELAKYLAIASPYDSKEDGVSTSLFMTTIRTIISNEQGSWQAQANQSHANSKTTKPPIP